MAWWSSDGRERYWVEIRKDLAGLGTELWCPDHQQGATERSNPWYELVGAVRKGDTVYHYNEREKRFVGRSIAAENVVHDPHERSYSVELIDFQPIAASIDLAFLRGNRRRFTSSGKHCEQRIPARRSTRHSSSAKPSSMG